MREEKNGPQKLLSFKGRKVACFIYAPKHKIHVVFGFRSSNGCFSWLRFNAINKIFYREPILKPRGKRKTQDPCDICLLHRERCICAHIPELRLQTKVTLVIHAKELKRTTNTGRLAIQALKNSEMRVRGRDKTPLDLSSILSPHYQSVLFYPGNDATDLTAEFVSSLQAPLHLIVPDGNWRQASKVHYRHPEIAHLPRVMIKLPNLSQFHLRTESSAEGMATLQAIAHALGIIEGESVKEELLKLYERKLRQTLLSRGVKQIETLTL